MTPNQSLQFDDKLIIRYVHKNGNLWSVKSIELKPVKPEVLNKWRVRLELILDQVKQKCQRPKQLLAFINPYGGKGEAIRLNASIVKPLFQSCHIECKVIITERANHARYVFN